MDAARDPPPWTPELCRGIARRLGRAQSQPPPDVPWLGRGFLREYLRLHGVRSGQDVVRRLDEMPSTLCHNDLHPGNVLGAQGEVVVDWPYCGLGAVGLDAGVLVADGVADAVLPVERADEFATAVWDYINRSMPRDAEGSLAPDQVYAVTAFLLYKNGILKESDVLDAKTLPKVQMPNRSGFFPPKPEATAKNGNWKPNWNRAKPVAQ